MKKILLLLGVVMMGQAMAQVTSTQIGPILVPKFAGATKASPGDTTRTPIIFRVRFNGLKPNEKYKYITKGSDTTDLKTRALSTGGAGNMITFNSNGTFKYISGQSLTTAGRNDTFETNMMGEYEGWFGLINTSNARFAAGKTIYPLFVALSLTSNDTLIGYCADGITFLDYGTASTNATLVWGASQAVGKSFVALYDVTNSAGVRPLSIGMVENSVVSSGWKSFTPTAVKNKVIGVTGMWSAFIPNNLSGGLKRIENLNLSNGFLAYANNDGDGVWGPSKKSTVNASGGAGSHIYLDNDDAALVPTKVEFWARTSSTKEDIGKYNVFVTRKFSDEKDQTVRFYIAGGTSVKGATNDYTVTERTITFKGSGAAISDTSVITINDDNSAEGPETIVLGIDQPNNCVIGTEKAHTITVADNDIANVDNSQNFDRSERECW
jgi:hypothetical protein